MPSLSIIFVGYAPVLFVWLNDGPIGNQLLVVSATYKIYADVSTQISPTFALVGPIGPFCTWILLAGYQFAEVEAESLILKVFLLGSLVSYQSWPSIGLEGGTGLAKFSSRCKKFSASFSPNPDEFLPIKLKLVVVSSIVCWGTVTYPLAEKS